MHEPDDRSRFWIQFEDDGKQAYDVIEYQLAQLVHISTLSFKQDNKTNSISADLLFSQLNGENVVLDEHNENVRKDFSVLLLLHTIKQVVNPS